MFCLLNIQRNEMVHGDRGELNQITNKITNSALNVYENKKVCYEVNVLSLQQFSSLIIT